MGLGVGGLARLATLSLTPHRDLIDRCFSGNSVEDIVAALQSEVGRSRTAAGRWVCRRVSSREGP